MNVRHLREHGDARIDHDDRELALFQRHLEAPVNDRVLLRQVGAERKQAFGMLEVVIAAGRAVGTERALVAGHGRRHAQRGVAVVVVGADHPARQFAQGVELFAEDLAGGHDGDGVAAVFLLDALDFRGGAIEGIVPPRLAVDVDGLFPQQRRFAAVRGIEQLMLEYALDAELALVDRRVRHAARGHGLALGIEPDFYRTAGGAVATGGVLPVDHALVGDLDRVPGVASE